MIIIGNVNIFSIEKDPCRNVMKRLSGVNTNRGVFSDEFELSDVPIFGDWEISATVGDQVCFHSFLLIFRSPGHRLEID